MLVDEAQFLTRAQVEQLTDIADRLRIPVLCYGLRTDFQGNLFEGSQWLLAWADNLIELKTICHCGRKATMVLRLDASGSNNDFPRSYKLELSADGQNWGKPVATGEGESALTEIKLPATKTKFLRVTQTGTAPGKFWSIHELDVLSDTKGQITAGKATAKLPSLE